LGKDAPAKDFSPLHFNAIINKRASLSTGRFAHFQSQAYRPTVDRAKFQNLAFLKDLKFAFSLQPASCNARWLHQLFPMKHFEPLQLP
jgi:hypothetical protein